MKCSLVPTSKLDSQIPHTFLSCQLKDKMSCIHFYDIYYWLDEICSSVYVCACVFNRFSCVWLFAILWTVARRAPLSMGFSRQEHWNGLTCPPPERIFLTQRLNLRLLCLLHWQSGSWPLVLPGKPCIWYIPHEK